MTSPTPPFSAIIGGEDPGGKPCTDKSCSIKKPAQYWRLTSHLPQRITDEFGRIE
jgi:hypothetical protein